MPERFRGELLAMGRYTNLSIFTSITAVGRYVHARYSSSL